MGNAAGTVYNDTEEHQQIYVFNYADGIRSLPVMTVVLTPGKAKWVEAAAHGSGLIVSTDLYDKGHHAVLRNGGTLRISQLLKQPGNHLAKPLTVVASVGAAIGAIATGGAIGGAVGGAIATPVVTGTIGGVAVAGGSSTALGGRVFN